MIYENLDKNIANAMIEEKNSADKLKTNFWKGVKTEMVNAVHNGTNLPDDGNEIKILKSMLKRCKNAVAEFQKAGNSEVAKQNIVVNEFEISMLENLLPKEADENDVAAEANLAIENIISQNGGENFDLKTLQRYTKQIIDKVKEKYPTANNAIIAGAVKNYIKMS